MTSLNDILAAEAKRLGYNQPATFDGSAVRKLHVVGNDNPRAQRWVSSKIDAQVEELAAMGPDSGRNHALNAIAYSLGRLAPRWVDPGEIADQLLVACMTNGLVAEDGRRQCEATITSGLSKGMQDPRDPPISDDDSADGWLKSLPEAERPAAPAGVNPDTGEVDEPVEDDAEALSRLVREKLPVIDWHALWADDSTEEWIVEPLLPARRLVALYSAPKMGKSLLLLELCCAIATGRDVLGVSIDRPRNVLYVDFENDPKADVRERLQAMGYGPDDLGRLFYLSFPTLAALDTDRGGQEVMAAVAEYECEVVVVDTVSRSIAGEENENDTWLNFYRHTGLRMKQLGIALIRLDHSGKDESKGQRGGSAKSGDVDAVWRLSKVSDDVYRLDCEAARMPIVEKTLVLHRETTPLRHRVDAEGRAGAFRIQVDHARAALDAVGVPLEFGRDKARAELKKHGVKASNGPLAKAIEERRNLSADRSAEWAD